MNFLAHALLAGDAPADRLGGLIGDFVKGPLPAGLPPDVAAGVALHRAIDVFADAHPAFRRSRARVSAERRRVAGVMIDMFYDHFLARHWPLFAAEPLEDFAARMYRLMGEHAALLPPRLALILPRMRDDDWLSAYRSADAIAAALERIALRLRRTNTLAGSGEELLRHYAAFEADFFDFIADARRFTAMQRAARLPRAAAPLNAAE
jgi:acyl carrier protein phosphodiesterase